MSPCKHIVTPPKELFASAVGSWMMDLKTRVMRTTASRRSALDNHRDNQCVSAVLPYQRQFAIRQNARFFIAAIADWLCRFIRRIFPASLQPSVSSAKLVLGEESRKPGWMVIISGAADDCRITRYPLLTEQGYSVSRICRLQYSNRDPRYARAYKILMPNLQAQ